ncbi:MAG: hypothetical protein ACYC6X_00790 [Minisyncoccota bacterium]
MTTPEQIAYIRQQLAAGVTRRDITDLLAQSGWARADIDEAFAIVAPEPVPAVTSPVARLAPTGTQSAQVQAIAPASSGRRPIILIIAAGALIAILGGTVVYAYTQKLWPFAHAPYTADNLISGLLSSSAGITAASYGLSASLAVATRDEGAAPFTAQIPNEAQLVKQYQDDSVRARDISNLLAVLRVQNQRGVYPPNLQEAIANLKTRNSYYASYYRNVSTTDPISGQAYGYTVTDGGKDFALSATFETAGAVSAVRNAYGFSATTTIINGQTVSFTKGSSTYFSVPAEPPKPFLMQMGEMMRFLPPEIAASVSAAATTDWSKGSMADWKFNIDATGDFGDLSYKVDADALKKGTDYYFRINNMPSLFGDALSSLKGQWVVADASSSAATSSYANGGELQFIASQLPTAEKSYKEERAQVAASLKALAASADAVHLFSFKNPPQSDQVDGRSLYRYDLEVNKDAILAFYKKVVDEANTNADLKNLGIFDDPGMIEYLQSDEFSQTFDYYNKNTTLTLWVDPQGFPAVVQYTMRVVPPDTATQLSGKQVNITWKLTLSNINQPVDIAVPTNAKPIQDLINQFEKNANYPLSSLDAARMKGNDAAIESDLSTVQVQAELYYGGVGRNSYGTQAWTSGAATSCKNGMFRDATIAKTLAGADTANGAGNVACYANGRGYLVGADLASGGWWCIDSLGDSRVEAGSVSAVAPQSKVCH